MIYWPLVSLFIVQSSKQCIQGCEVYKECKIQQALTVRKVLGVGDIDPGVHQDILGQIKMKKIILGRLGKVNNYCNKYVVLSFKSSDFVRYRKHCISNETHEKN